MIDYKYALDNYIMTDVHTDEYTFAKMCDAITETLNNFYDFESEYKELELDYALEAKFDQEHTIPVYVILSTGHTALTKAIKFVTRAEFSHSSISFNSRLSPMYSFGSKKLVEMNPRKMKEMLDAMGFVVTTPTAKLWGDKPCPYAVYVTFVSQVQKKMMNKRLKWFIQNSDKLKYSFTGLIRNLFHMKDPNNKKWFCSAFVAAILNAGGKLPKDETTYRPEELRKLPDFVEVGRGPAIQKYDEKQVIMNVKKLMNQQDKGNQVTESYDMADEGFIDFVENIKSQISSLFDVKESSDTVIAKWKDSIFGPSSLLSTPPRPKKYITIDEVIVDEKRGLITLQKLNYPLLKKRMREVYGERGIFNIFEATYRDKDIKKFNKKKMSRSQMKITSLYTPIFFALEVSIIFRDLYEVYKTPQYSRISNNIYKKTWLSKTDNSTPKTKINLSKLSNLKKDYSLKDYQLEFIKKYPQLKHKLDLDGYVLAFEQGLGKTLTACALTECLEVDKIYIVCPLTLTKNWKNEIGDYFDGKYDSCICGSDTETSKTKFYITNNEGIAKMMPFVKANEKNVLIVDECHNFRNIEGSRTKELLDLRDKAKFNDILLLSGTPLKASPDEMVPALSLLDKKFTPHAAAIYTAAFRYKKLLGMNIVRARFADIMYRKTKIDANLGLPEKHIEDLKLKIKDSEKYLISNIKKEVRELYDQYYEELLKNNVKMRDEFLYVVEKYSTADKRQTHGYMNKISKLSDDDMTMGDLHEIDQQFMDTFLDKFVFTNPNFPKNKAKDIKHSEGRLIFMKRSAMGKAIGQIYPKYRAEMYIALYEENKPLILDMINKALKKTVIFSLSLPVVNYICDDLNKHGIKTLKVIGGTNTKERNEIIDRFKYDETYQVIIATIQTMNTGVTLTMANQLFFFGKLFRETDNLQAMDRIHRIGQDVDCYIWNVLLDTGEAMNLSYRMTVISRWSENMFSTAMGDKAAPSIMVSEEDLEFGDKK